MVTPEYIGYIANWMNSLVVITEKYQQSSLQFTTKTQFEKELLHWFGQFISISKAVKVESGLLNELFTKPSDFENYSFAKPENHPYAFRRYE